MRLAALACLVLAAGCAAPADEAPAAAPEAFAAVAEAHVAAIAARDLDALLETITEHDSLTLVFPDGTTLHTRQQYVDFHAAWFDDPAWTMDVRPVARVVRPGLAIAHLRTTYTDAAGPRDAVLALTFADEGGAWRLVFDQNTRVAEAPAGG